MTYPQAIVAAAALFAVALIVTDSRPTTAQARRAGSYQIAPQAVTGNVWIVNTATGDLRLCKPPPTFATVVVDCTQLPPPAKKKE